MPIVSVFIVGGIVFAFIAFAVVLAWGEYQTRNVSQAADEHAGTRAQVQSLKLVADNAGRGRAVGAEAKQA